MDRQKSRLQGSLPPELNETEREVLADEADVLLADLAHMRGWTVRARVGVVFKSHDFFAAFLRKSMEEDYPLSKRDGFAEAMAWMGWRDLDGDWIGRSAEAQAYGTLGLYDPDTKIMYITAERNPRKLRGTLIHELVHALQDQNYDFEKVQKLYGQRDQDGRLALQSLWEGEAVALTWQYERTLGEDPELSRVTDFRSWLELKRVIQNGMLRGMGCRGQVPSLYHFPYVEGALAIQERALKKGWSSVDLLWRKPPTSSREILQPDVRFPSVPSPDFKGLEGLLPKGSRKAWSDRLGVQGMWDWLCTANPDRTAREAVEGWLTDGFEFWICPNGKRVLWALARFENPEAAGRFYTACRRTQTSRFGASEDVMGDESVSSVPIPGGADEVSRLERLGKDVLLVEGLEEARAERARNVVWPAAPP